MAKFDYFGVNKTDTLAATLAAGATSATLTSGNFGTQTGLQLLVIDYDVPAKIEVVSCAIAGTALSTLTRNLDGTSDVEHTAGAKVLHTLVPTHWDQLQPLAASDAWTAWVPTFSASGSMTYTSVTANKAVYRQVGKLVFFRIDASGTTGGTASTTLFFTLPVTAKDTFGPVGTGLVIDTSAMGAFAYFESATQAGVQKYNVANFSLAAGIAHRISGVYEAA